MLVYSIDYQEPGFDFIVKEEVLQLRKIVQQQYVKWLVYRKDCWQGDQIGENLNLRDKRVYTMALAGKKWGKRKQR